MKYFGLILLFATVASAQVVAVRPGRKVMIFGGENHKVYLGCLSCTEFATDSVLNEFGHYGSEYSSESIFNSFGSYGGKFRSTSACNEFATEPPVIVDNRGNYYGELTMNEARSKRVKSGSVLAWLSAVCEDH